MKLTSKITWAAVGAVLCGLTIGTAIQRFALLQFGAEEARKQMRTIVRGAEAVREHMARLGAREIYDVASIEADLKLGKPASETSLFEAVPIVAAINNARETAAEAGYDFRVPKFQPRNPRNEPTAAEAEILRYLKESGEEEYFEVDSDLGEVVFARPIKLSNDCLQCHGDPANSPNGDGTDVFGQPMEGWKAGEIHGAFVLRNDLSNINAASRDAFVASLGVTLAVILPIVGLTIFGFWRFNKRFVVSPLAKITQKVLGQVDQQRCAASEAADTAQNVARVSCSQAAAVEETSASIDEMTSITSGFADHASQTTELAAQSRSSVEQCVNRAERLGEAMSAIQESSDSISSIISTIEEIAFQTNLLALNASVEAARAGEAGAGFAVVADGVRALAMRASDAAKESAGRIEEASERSREGVEIGREFSERLQGIGQDMAEIDQRMGDIAASARRHTDQTGQIKVAIDEIDRATQGQAAAADESAGISQSLADGTDELERLALRLAEMIGQDTGGESGKPAVEGAQRASTKPSPELDGYTVSPTEFPESTASEKSEKLVMTR